MPVSPVAGLLLFYIHKIHYESESISLVLSLSLSLFQYLSLSLSLCLSLFQYLSPSGDSDVASPRAASDVVDLESVSGFGANDGTDTVDECGVRLPAKA